MVLVEGTKTIYLILENYHGKKKTILNSYQNSKHKVLIFQIYYISKLLSGLVSQ